MYTVEDRGCEGVSRSLVEIGMDPLPTDSAVKP